MKKLNIDLNRQAYPVFDLTDKSNLEIGTVNFIFGKNGTGKSTFSKVIMDQYSNDPKYEVHIFTGMEDLLVENKLNTIVLGEENKEAKKNIDIIDNKLESKNNELAGLENKLKSLEWKIEYKEIGIDKHNLYIKAKESKYKFDKQKQLMEDYYTFAAKKIREFDSKIKLTLQNYDKNSFKREINKSSELIDSEVEDCQSKLLEEPKEKIEFYKINEHDYQKRYNSILSILSQQPKQLIVLEETGENPKKKAFALRGKEIHSVGDKCAFCGSVYTESRKIELQNYFSLDEMEEINQKITDEKGEIEALISELKAINELKQSNFYSFLNKDIENVNQKLISSKQMILSFLDNLDRTLTEKQKDMFTSTNLKIETIPKELSDLITEINDLITKHNLFSDNFKKKQEEARKKLRLHFVNKILVDIKKYPFKRNWEAYLKENLKLESLQTRYSEDKEMLQSEIKLTLGNEKESGAVSIISIKKEIEDLENQKKEFLKATRNTHYLADVINKKLKASGKDNLQLKACNLENDIECYMILDEQENIREISKISTGEKNIIAFLYFIGNLKSVESKANKIIIFDDPMTSNDDTLQYLMITELQRLHRGTNKIFKREKDVFICMSHNVHFHLNLQPQGNFEDKNGKTKYDKNYFYVLRNGKFYRILSEKEDFKTSYESLWIELNDLYKNDYLNSMLNSMRRIVETFIKFNKIHQDTFYKDKEEHMKIFNVNSHEAIEELSADAIGKTKEELADMFEYLFSSNGFDSHFNTYWKQ